jgi:hypothetical protein
MPQTQKLSIVPGSTLYLVPSDATPELRKRLKHADFKMVSTPADAEYTASCNALTDADKPPLGWLGTLSIGGNYPMSVTITVRYTKTGKVVFTRTGDTLGGASFKRVKRALAARFCASQLTALDTTHGS